MKSWNQKCWMFWLLKPHSRLTMQSRKVLSIAGRTIQTASTVTRLWQRLLPTALLPRARLSVYRYLRQLHYGRCILTVTGRTVLRRCKMVWPQLSPEDLTQFIETSVSVCLTAITSPSRLASADDSVFGVWTRLLDLSFGCPRYSPATPSQRYTPLCAAVIAGQKDVVSALLQARVNLDAHGCADVTELAVGTPGVDRSSPVMLALAQGHERIALELLQAGANADAINPDTGASVLKNAFLAPNARKVEALVKYHESHAATQGSTCSPLPLRCVHSKAPPESASAASVLRVVTVHCVRSSTAAQTRTCVMRLATTCCFGSAWAPACPAVSSLCL